MKDKKEEEIPSTENLNTESSAGAPVEESSVPFENPLEHGEEVPAPHAEEKHDSLLDKLGLGKKKHKGHEVDDLKKQLEELNDKHLRLVAEFDNFRKRNARERLELLLTAGKETIVSVLPVLDDFQRAAKQMETATDVQAVREGVSLISSKMKNILEQRGLQAMTSIGEPFDPERHEAVTEIEVTDENMKGKVVDEIETGYMLADKIIRHAKVVVGK